MAQMERSKPATSASAAIFFSLLVSSSVLGSAAAPVIVGVVLDMTSDLGKKSLACISIALDDFYAAHAGAARVELRVRDSRGEVVAAARAADDLIRKDRVQAIIGPQTEAESDFIAYLGNYTQTPILSFAPTPAALTPFFLHTAPNEFFQVAPVAAILDMFAWRTSIVVYQDSPYVASILPRLFYALEGYNTRIMDNVALPIDATEDYIKKVLYNLKGTPTRVFIVHMLPDLAARVFHQATAAGMMSGGYVWIATCSIGSVVDSLSSDKIDDMQGVIAFRPYVQPTAHVMNFTSRFKAKIRLENPDIHDVVNPNMLLLSAYDTTWALAKAVDIASGQDIASVSSLTPGRTLLDTVLNTTFHGLTGRFSLVNGHLQLPSYEVVNINSKGARTVGFWIPKFRTFRKFRTNNEEGLNHILWPGDLVVPPKGWDMSSSGHQLRILVPIKRGFNQLVEVSYNPTTNSSTAIGYCIDSFNMLIEHLPYQVAYQYVPINDSSGNYDSLLSLVYEKKADGVVGDMTITVNRMNKVAFTIPFTDTGLSMVVLVKRGTIGGMWIFVQPLTTTLWIASLAFFVFTGFVVWVIEHRINPEFHGTCWQQFGIIFYFAFSTLVFSHREKLESNLSRFMVIVWVFVVLILTSSYTASLTSMMTVQQLQPTVTSVQDLLRNRDYVGYQEGSAVAYWLEDMGFHKENLLGYTTVEEYAEALQRGSGNGGVSAIFDEIPYLKVFLSKYCEGYTMVGPTYKLGGFGFAFPIGSPMVHDISQAIWSLAAQEEMERIEKKWFGDPGVCDSKSSSIDSSSLNISNFSGLFIITGTVSSLVLLIHLAIFIYRERDKLRTTMLTGIGAANAFLHICLQRLGGAKDWKFPIFKGLCNMSSRNSGNGVNQLHRARTEAAAICV